MPLRKIHHPAGAYTAEEKKEFAEMNLTDHAGVRLTHGKPKVNGVEIHYAIGGAGEPVFLLHPGKSSAPTAARHGEHPGANMSAAGKPIGRACQQPTFAVSDVWRSQRTTRNTAVPGAIDVMPCDRSSRQATCWPVSKLPPTWREIF